MFLGMFQWHTWDLILVSVPIYLDSVLQLPSDSRVFQFKPRTARPLATTVSVFSFLFLVLATYTTEGMKSADGGGSVYCSCNTQ